MKKFIIMLLILIFVSISNTMSLDLAVLGFDLNNFIAHFTMNCDNNNLVGTTYNPVTEPATIILLGSGLVVFASINRKRIKSKLS